MRSEEEVGRWAGGLWRWGGMESGRGSDMERGGEMTTGRAEGETQRSEHKESTGKARGGACESTAASRVSLSTHLTFILVRTVQGPLGKKLCLPFYVQPASTVRKEILYVPLLP